MSYIEKEYSKYSFTDKAPEDICINNKPTIYGRCYLGMIGYSLDFMNKSNRTFQNYLKILEGKKYGIVYRQKNIYRFTHEFFMDNWQVLLMLYEKCCTKNTVEYVEELENNYNLKLMGYKDFTEYKQLCYSNGMENTYSIAEQAYNCAINSNPIIKNIYNSLSSDIAKCFLLYGKKQ